MLTNLFPHTGRVYFINHVRRLPAICRATSPGNFYIVYAFFSPHFNVVFEKYLLFLIRQHCVIKLQVSIICSDPSNKLCLSHLPASIQPEKWSFFKSLTKSFRVFVFWLKVQSMTGLLAFLCVFTLLFAIANSQVYSNDTMSAEDDSGEMEYVDEEEIFARLSKIDSV